MPEEAHGDADFAPSYNNQIGKPVAMNSSGVTGGLVADDLLVPAALVAVTEQL